MPRQQKKRKPGKFYQINDYIRADSLRVVDEKGTQLGVLSKAEALARAQSIGADLVIVAPNTNPPVAKIIDFAKFKYQQKQKDSSGSKKTKTQDIKEIHFTPFIAENDFNTRINRAKEFLTDGDKVRLVVKFVGRQITHKEFGDSIITKAIEALEDFATTEREPALRGKLLIATLSPAKKGKKSTAAQTVENNESFDRFDKLTASRTQDK